MEEFDGSEMHRIESRVRRLNALGFDVAELDITTDFAGRPSASSPRSWTPDTTPAGCCG